MSSIHIVINNVGGGSDGQDLMGCYFEHKENGTYKFFDKYGKNLASNLTVGCVFNFTLDYEPNINWQLTIGLNSNSLIVIGNWSNPSTTSARSDRYWEQDGSYTAQAGGTLVEDEMIVAGVMAE